MAIDTAGVALSAGEARSGRQRSILTDKATYVLKSGQGFLGKLIVGGAGTTWTIDIYDSTTNESGKLLWSYVTADGRVNLELNIPCNKGITVVSGGTTAGFACIVWE